MNLKTVKVLKNNLICAEKCGIADNPWSRLIGLWGRKELPVGEGMYFPKCNSVHTWFMFIPIDVVFINREGRISSLHPRVRPNKIIPLLDLKSDAVFEFGAGTIERARLEIGDELCIS